MRRSRSATPGRETHRASSAYHRWIAPVFQIRIRACITSAPITAQARPDDSTLLGGHWLGGNLHAGATDAYQRLLRCRVEFFDDFPAADPHALRGVHAQ